MNKKLREDDEEVFRQNMFKAGPDDDHHDGDVGPDDHLNDADVGADYHLHDDVDDLHDCHVHDDDRITMRMVMKK